MQPTAEWKLTVIGAHDAAVLSADLQDEDWSKEKERLFVEDGRVSYDQFAPRAADLLKRSTVVRKCFSHAYPLILVDEFQNTDEEQWRLIRTLAEESEIIALGDSEQRMYAWRKGVSETRRQGFAASFDATTFDQIVDNHREASRISAMTMHQLKGREYDSVLLVEDEHRIFRGDTTSRRTWRPDDSCKCPSREPDNSLASCQGPGMRRWM